MVPSPASRSEFINSDEFEVLDSLSYFVCVLTEDRNNLFLNKSLREYFEVDVPVVQSDFYAVLPDVLADAFETHLVNVSENETRQELVEVPRSSGENQWQEWNYSFQTGESNGEGFYLAEGRNVRSYRRTRRELKQSLEEKETLLRETHHRVKSNFQTIASILRIQADDLEVTQAAEALLESCHRVKAMARIHEQIHQLKNYDVIDVTLYLRNLVQSLVESHEQPSATITHELSLGVNFLPVEVCIDLGLIVTELVVNAIKHGLSGQDGTIRVSLDKTGSNCELTVSDTGEGIVQDLSLDSVETMGLRLVNQLVEEQLNGTLEVTSNGETTFTASFPSP